MSRKREILELLTADELRGLVDRFDVEVGDRRAKDGMVEALARAHRVKLDEPLVEYPRARLKIVATRSAAQQESRTFADLRDLLLPKLLSGELRIRDAERAVEAAL